MEKAKAPLAASFVLLPIIRNTDSDTIQIQMSTFAVLRSSLRSQIRRRALRTVTGGSIQQQILSSQRFALTSRSFSSSSDTPASAPTESHEFQAETRQLLDIVTHSLYTDKEVFLRELVSNASDSLEKLRHMQATGAAIVDPDVPLEIRIELDEVTSTITITDTGIGLTREEMISNLGTIARSGSKNFVQQLQQTATTGVDPSKGIIGRFGVGFYSAFMVGLKVDVRSKSALAENESLSPKIWTSEGTGTYDIADLDEGVRQNRGSSIVIHLKEEYWDFINENRIEKILKRYSNFVGFPIFLNGNRVNTLDAIWTKDPKEVENEAYVDFYKYIANAVDDPLDIYVSRRQFVPFHGLSPNLTGVCCIRSISEPMPQLM